MKVQKYWTEHKCYHVSSNMVRRNQKAIIIESKQINVDVKIAVLCQLNDDFLLDCPGTVLELAQNS